jgi:hypothetical protein
MFKFTPRPKKSFGRMRWPFWSADAMRCSACNFVIVSTARGKRNTKNLE